MRWILALAAASLVLLAGCGTQQADSSAGSGSSLIGTGEVADLDFTANTAEGVRFDGTSLEGKPGFLWFWAPWCPTCRAQSVSALAEQYDGEVAFVGVGGLDSAQAIRELAGQTAHVTHLVDKDDWCGGTSG